MEQLKMIKDQIVAQVAGQMGNLKEVNTKELGEAIDMIKDLSEAMYYCEVYKAMEEHEDKQEMGTNNYYYTERYYPQPNYYRDMDREQGRMYYPNGGSQMTTGNSGSSGSNGNSYYGGQIENPEYMGGGDRRNYYTERDYPQFRDEREGRSPVRRRMYMESKDTHQDSSKAMKELEAYMQELTSDMMELVGKASPEEKVMLQKKVNNLATKLQNV